jgi:hypothetical protein
VKPATNRLSYGVAYFRRLHIIIYASYHFIPIYRQAMVQ